MSWREGPEQGDAKGRAEHGGDVQHHVLAPHQPAPHGMLRLQKQTNELLAIREESGMWWSPRRCN